MANKKAKKAICLYYIYSDHTKGTSEVREATIINDIETQYVVYIENAYYDVKQGSVERNEMHGSAMVINKNDMRAKDLYANMFLTPEEAIDDDIKHRQSMIDYEQRSLDVSKKQLKNLLEMKGRCKNG